jgi:DNA-binding LacI/PurR family transcriptional regulator
MAKSGAPTVREVAQEAGVTAMTVSRVLRGAPGFSAATGERVMEAVRRLGYTPNGLAQGLKTRRTRTVALLIGNVASPFFALVARGFEAAVREAGYLTMICSTDQSPDQEGRYLEVLLQRRVDGLAIAPVESEAPALRAFQEQGIPIVLVDRDAPALRTDGVTADGEAGAADATRHLLEAHGHRRIAGLFGPEETSTGRERRAGYEAALRAAGLAVDGRLVAHCAYTLEAGRAAALRLLGQSPRPTALLAAGNFLTAGALEALAERGLRVPEDVALIGFGPAPRSALERPDLTMVGMPGEAMGHRAARLLLDRIGQSGPGGAGAATGATARVEAPKKERLPVELLLSRSCGCPG